MSCFVSKSIVNKLKTCQTNLKKSACKYQELFVKFQENPRNEKLNRQLQKIENAVLLIAVEQNSVMEMLNAEIGTQDMVTFPASPPEGKSSLHEIDAAKIAFMLQLRLVTHEEHRKMSLIINTTTNRRSKRKKRSTENENFVYSYSTAKKTNTTLKKKKYLTV
ncbi:hypothetical protein WA026_008322 [Henosepilachna vigintioctopunctata]|uniref:Uncharacterized protein n=1 Tax=Henosepilachna vigintioctopunctata TaxID=420089 RepID=A0AAW1UGM7_9CUCU